MVSVDKLPPEFAAAYSFSHFNRLQSACFSDLFCSSTNLVISAPTASGKTVLMEIAICRLFSTSAGKNCVKALYLAPLTSLCAEKATEWTSQFAQCELRTVQIVGGDASSAQEDSVSALDLFASSQIICTTPEKFVAVTRRLSCTKLTGLLGTTGLILIDECHMVGTTRGGSLELAVSLVRMYANRARIIAVSATVSNIGDVAQWLGSTSNSTDANLPTAASAKTMVFGEEFRPVPLTKVVMGFNCTGPYYQFQRNLDFKLPGIINTHAAGRSVLIFCSTRGATQESCRHLSHNIRQLSNRPMPIHLTSAFTNQQLNERVEQLFVSGSIQILFSTSTLGIGVNMPAYMVIVKGTKGYADNNYAEYTMSEVLQFIGRAGRPHLSTELVRWILGGVHRHEFAAVQDVTRWYLDAICNSGEFDELRITTGQKGVLNELNKSPWIKYKVKGRVQASNNSLRLSLDMNRIVQIAYGLAMCAREWYAERGDVLGVANATVLSRELVAKCAEGSPAVLQQVDGIDPRYSELLWSQGIKSISQLCDTGAREIEHFLMPEHSEASSLPAESEYNQYAGEIELAEAIKQSADSFSDQFDGDIDFGDCDSMLEEMLAEDRKTISANTIARQSNAHCAKPPLVINLDSGSS
ncbi:ATP-dependent DNA helicase MER3 [Coemansia thaxteri]|nr:ATP-dependent DNA helicase MER3 [Coemansia thaxteri]